MEEFSQATGAMIFQAMGKTPDSSLSPSEAENLDRHHAEIMADISIIALKELEAYLALNTCISYDQLAKLIEKREGKNLSGEEHEKLLGRLRTRAHRGREKVLKKIRQIYQTEE